MRYAAIRKFTRPNSPWEEITFHEFPTLLELAEFMLKNQDARPIEFSDLEVSYDVNIGRRVT